MQEITVTPNVRLDWSPLASRRRAANMSQRELGLAVGVHKMTIWRIEKGLLDPRASLAIRIARAMGVPWYQLVTVLDSP